MGGVASALTGSANPTLPRVPAFLKEAWLLLPSSLSPPVSIQNLYGPQGVGENPLLSFKLCWFWAVDVHLSVWPSSEKGCKQGKNSGELKPGSRNARDEDPLAGHLWREIGKRGGNQAGAGRESSKGVMSGKPCKGWHRRAPPRMLECKLNLRGVLPRSHGVGFSYNFIRQSEGSQGDSISQELPAFCARGQSRLK